MIMESIEQRILNVAEEGMHFGLARMQYLLERTQHPEREIRVIHIGGTNGKGSTLNFLQHILTENGYQVGTFSSPSMTSFCDQIKINNEMISESELNQLFQEIFPIIMEMKKRPIGGPTVFEITTILAILYFACMKSTDYCIFEVGLGGRTDATNIVQPILTMLTNISLEHTQYLGSTVLEIAREKGGIIKRRIPLITGVQDVSALKELERIANENQSLITQVPANLSTNLDIKTGHLFFTTQLEEPLAGSFSIQMLGAHQVQNATLALYGLAQLIRVDMIAVTREKIALGLYRATWPGRLEQRMAPFEMILDGAHNVEGIEKLQEALALHFPNRRIILLFSASADKDLDEMIERLQRISSQIHITTFSFHRSIDEAAARALAGKYALTYEMNWKNWLTKLQVDKEELLVITGSLYFISEVRKALSSGEEGEQQ